MPSFCKRNRKRWPCRSLNKCASVSVKNQVSNVALDPRIAAWQSDAIWHQHEQVHFYSWRPTVNAESPLASTWRRRFKIYEGSQWRCWLPLTVLDPIILFMEFRLQCKWIHVLHNSKTRHWKNNLALFSLIAENLYRALVLSRRRCKCAAFDKLQPRSLLLNHFDTQMFAFVVFNKHKKKKTSEKQCTFFKCSTLSLGC
jgi:hypothetical protein